MNLLVAIIMMFLGSFNLNSTSVELIEDYRIEQSSEESKVTENALVG